MSDVAIVKPAQNGLRTIASLEGAIFTVPNYQRGYKWSVQEVNDLLEDIEAHTSQAPYCLQPLVLRKTGNQTFDLIDGQQRCTTIYILLSYLNKEPPTYTLKYQTRAASEVFLAGIYQMPYVGQSDGWERLIADQPEWDNIDNFHFYQALQTIHSHFSQTPDTKGMFLKTLRYHTAFIWYEVGETSASSETIFRNFNSGKIRLTDGELIKAMIILRIQEEPNQEIRELKIAEFAFEWEVVEAGLQEDEFWYFLTGNRTTFSTRIDLLFQLEAKRAPGKDPNRVVFQEWAKSDHVTQQHTRWKKIVALYQKLRDWHQDVPTYHLIGFLNTTGFSDLKKILDLSESLTLKDELNQHLTELVAKKFAVERKRNDEPSYQPYRIDKLHYLDEREAVQNTLLLFNVKSYEKLIPGTRFPFWRYNDPEQRWSIEHIHPQNPRALKTVAEAWRWLEEQKSLLELKDHLLQQISEEQSRWQKEDQSPIPKLLAEKLAQFSATVSQDFELHSIGNLALLDAITNSEIGNKPFLEKRRHIIDTTEFETERLIPLATRNVFSKYYTRSDETIGTSFWSVEDARYYKEAIETLLAGFLPKDKNVTP